MCFAWAKRAEAEIVWPMDLVTWKSLVTLTRLGLWEQMSYWKGFKWAWRTGNHRLWHRKCLKNMSFSLEGPEKCGEECRLEEGLWGAQSPEWTWGVTPLLGSRGSHSLLSCCIWVSVCDLKHMSVTCEGSLQKTAISRWGALCTSPPPMPHFLRSNKLCCVWLHGSFHLMGDYVSAGERGYWSLTVTTEMSQPAAEPPAPREAFADSSES